MKSVVVLRSQVVGGGRASGGDTVFRHRDRGSICLIKQRFAQGKWNTELAPTYNAA